MPYGYYENHLKYKSRLLPFICRDDSIQSTHYFVPHWHEGMEILHCISGRGRVNINGSFFDFTPGRTVIVNSNRIHSVISDTPKITYKCIILFEEFCSDNGIDRDKYTYTPVADSTEIARLFLKMHDDFHSGSSALKIRLDATELLYALTEGFAYEAQSTKEAATEGIKAAIDYINRNYADNITLDTIAHVSNLNRFYFTKKFKDMTGKTFNDFLGGVRCQKAGEIIKSGRTVNEACYAVGYSDPAYFSRVFKKFMGMPPSKYR